MSSPSGKLVSYAAAAHMDITKFEANFDEEIAMQVLIKKVPEAGKYKHLISITFENGDSTLPLYNLSKLPAEAAQRIQDKFSQSK